MSQHRSTAARDLVITCIKGEGKLLKFWALPITFLDTVKNFESRLGSLKPELDSSPGFARSEQIPVGFKCVVKAKTKQLRWCRAGVLAHQGYNAIVARLLDYGNDEVVLVSDVRNIEDPIMSVQPQAIECILADVMPAHNEWTMEAIKFCEQHLLYNTLSCFVVSEYMKLPVVRVAKKGESEAFVQRLINGGLALIKREMISPPPALLSYKINTLDPNSNHFVRISCFENSQKFYVQLSAAEMELKHLMDSINRLPKDSYNPLKVPAINTPCLSMLSAKPCYYRALITHIQQSQCKVFFVDYGFSEEKDIHELRAIPPTFLSLAAQAICFSLPREANIDPEEFKRFIGFEHLELHVLSRTNESYIVRLFYRGHDLLMSTQAAQNYIPHKLNIGIKYDVTVSYANDLSEFYCQPTQMKEQLNMISNVLNSGYKFSPVFLEECAPGKPVCAKFSEDNQWYRARIVKVNHEKDIEVFFVDFGNFDNINLSDVKKIGPDLLKYPIQSFKCFLHDTPLPTDPKARDDAFDLLEELTADQILLAHINTFAGDAGYGATLYMKNSPSSVNEKLLLKCVPVSVPVIPVNDIEDVYVTSFDSCKSFFVQFEKLDSEKLTIMQDEINTFYSGMQNSSFVPKEGNIVCARFHEDDQFYRARVEKCRDRQCDVFFIDYGNRETISVADVHGIDPKFTQYPQFGTECAFENFASQVPNDKLSEIMLENSFTLKMIRKEEDKWYVSVVENFPGNAAVLNLVKQLEVSSSSNMHVSLTNLPEDPGFATFFCHLLRTRTCVDVTFMLETPEGEKEEFHAHQLILAMRSSEFADKFYGHGRQEHYTIILRRVNTKAFKDMIRYCYGCKPALETTEEACDLFKLAKEYNLISLMNLCRTCLRDIQIQPDNVFSMLDVAEYMQDKSLKDKCYKLLEEGTRDVLSAYDLRDITPAMVRTIIYLPKLSLYSEYELIKWLIDWANAKVQEGDTRCENAREYLQKLLLFINILALTFEEFALLCKDYPDFFCSMEIANVYLNIAFPGIREMPDWHDKDLKLRQYTGSKM